MTKDSTHCVNGGRYTCWYRKAQRKHCKYKFKQKIDDQIVLVKLPLAHVFHLVKVKVSVVLINLIINSLVMAFQSLINIYKALEHYFVSLLIKLCKKLNIADEKGNEHTVEPRVEEPVG